MIRSPSLSLLPELCLAGALFAAACADSPAEPEALLVAREYRSALRVADELPTLPRLIARVPAEASPDALSRARVFWEGAREAGDTATAKSLREASYRLAAPVLAAELDSTALAGAQGALERWISVASSMLGAEAFAGSAFDDLRGAVDEAGALLQQARQAGAAGDRVAAVEATLRAADRLEATTPRELALRLLRRAEDALAARRKEGAEAGRKEDITLRRAQRLTLGARQAFAEGDYMLAIQRGYYATRLLEAE